MVLTFVLNGQEKSVPGLAAGATLAQVVAALGLRPDRIAIEQNGKIARREVWGSAPVEQGDRLELVHFVGGGSPFAGQPGCLATRLFGGGFAWMRSFGRGRWDTRAWAASSGCARLDVLIWAHSFGRTRLDALVRTRSPGGPAGRILGDAGLHRLTLRSRSGNP